MASTTAHPPSLAQSALRRPLPEVGAVCGKAARTDLCGGCEATRIPTATEAKCGGESPDGRAYQSVHARAVCAPIRATKLQNGRLRSLRRDGVAATARVHGYGNHGRAAEQHVDADQQSERPRRSAR